RSGSPRCCLSHCTDTRGAAVPAATAVPARPTTKAETMNSRCNGASNDAADMAAKPLESGSGRSGPADLTLKWNILLYFRKYRAKKVTSNSELPERQLNLAHFPLFGECRACGRKVFSINTLRPEIGRNHSSRGRRRKFICPAEIVPWMRS